MGTVLCIGFGLKNGPQVARNFHLTQRWCCITNIPLLMKSLRKDQFFWEVFLHLEVKYPFNFSAALRPLCATGSQSAPTSRGQNGIVQSTGDRLTATAWGDVWVREAFPLRSACEDLTVRRQRLDLRVLGCGFPVNFEFPPLPGKPYSVCLATEFA